MTTRSIRAGLCLLRGFWVFVLAAALAGCGGGGDNGFSTSSTASAAAAGVAAATTNGSARKKALAVPTDVYISELLASNNNGLQDEDGAYSDWFELRNPGGAPVDLTGWKVRDGSNTWTFPAVSIPAGGYLVVFASSKNRAIPGNALHTNFALSAGGEYLGLQRPDGTVVHEYAPSFPAQTANISYGVDANGDIRFFSTPTPGTANPVGDALSAGTVSVSPARGFYSAPVNVTLTATLAGATVRYTTDGSEPSLSNGSTYTTPIALNTTTTLRAAAFAAGRAPSPVFTTSYIITASVIAQGKGIPGFPDGRLVDVDTSGVKVPEYTAMNPTVTGHATYGPALPNALQAIPTISIAAPLSTIFGASGFYDSEDLEVPVSFEVLYPNDPASNAQVQAGAESHSHNRLKRSMRINFRSTYGTSTWNNDFFRRSPLNGASATTAIKSIVLRGGNNRAWSRNFNPDRTDFTLDQLYRDSQIAMQGVGSHGTFAHVYLNGVYWGLYNAVERPDEDFAASYGTGDDKDYFFINHGGATNGDPTRWDYLTGTLVNKDMSNAANYAEFTQYLDVQAFADYLLLSWWFGITDWPNNNFYLNFKTTAPTSPARYFAWDGEWSMDRKQGNTHQGAWVHPDFAPTATPTSTLGKLWKAAWANPQFRTLFAQRAALHTGSGGALTDASMLSRYDTLNAFVREAVIGESARWGDSLVPLGQPLRTRDVDWQNAVNAIRTLTNGNTQRLIAALTAAGYLAAPDAAPTVQSVSPANGATGVAVASTVTVRFSEPVVPNGGVTLATATGTPVAAAVAVSGSDVVLTPSAALSPSTAYRVRVSTAVKDAGGNALATAFESSFTTAVVAPPPATAELKVSRQANRSAAVALQGNTWQPRESVYVFLDTTAAATAVRFYLDAPTTGTPYRTETGAPWDFNGGGTATALPYVNNLAAGSHTIRAVLVAAGGGTQTFQATFTVGAPIDATPPRVLSIVPAANATGVATNAAITLTFSEPVVPNGGVTLALASGAAVPATQTITGSTVRLTPTAALAAGTAYRVTASTAVRDAAGNAMTAAFSSTFTTAAAAPPPPPPPTNSPQLKVSRAANRSGAVALGGNVWNRGERVYVFLDEPTAATAVRFFIDAPTTGTPYRTELGAPWDMAGGDTATASPYLNNLAVGSHTIRAVLVRANGTSTTYQATFTVR